SADKKYFIKRFAMCKISPVFMIPKNKVNLTHGKAFEKIFLISALLT
ncbi:MAG: hypothetical protein JG771_372, partial [Methermicoccus sp.]|nr:hypothetical protein [Methermicoccus sp.]